MKVTQMYIIERSVTDSCFFLAQPYSTQQVNLGTEKNQNVEVYNPLHPCLQRAYDILEPIFIEDVITSSPNGHNLLGDPSDDHDNDNANTRTWGHYLLSTLPPSASAVTKELTDRWEKHGNDTTPAEK